MTETRCPWCSSDPLMCDYHDREWGVPVRDDRVLFEMLLLEGAQAGLSWLTVLRKREHYRQVFDQFDPDKIVSYDENKIKALLQDSGIIRNRLKVQAAITNADSFLRVRHEFGQFSSYLWHFSNERPIVNQWQEMKQIPASSPLSDAIARDLKKRGFKFVGSTIIYAYLQSIGMINDHLVSCFRYPEIIGHYPTRDRAD
jgi:DNA-3-methyladenine glycosylase I